MQDSETVPSKEDGDIDIDSFVEASDDQLYSHTGMARLKSCEVIRNPPSGLPRDYVNKYDSFAYEKYFLFEAEMVGRDNKEVYVLMPAEKDHKEVRIAYDWTDSNDVSGLAGSVIPVTKKTKNSYRVEDFDGIISSLLSTSTISDLIDREVFIYSDGDWSLNPDLVLYSMLLPASAFPIAIFLTSSMYLGIALIFSLPASVFIYRSAKKR